MFRLFTCVFAITAFICNPVRLEAATYSWYNSTGDWSNPYSWNPPWVSMLAGDEALFSDPQTVPPIVDSGSPLYLVGTITFNPTSGSYTVTGSSSSLALNDPSGTANINVLAGSNTMSSTMILQSQLNITVSSGLNFSYSGSILSPSPFSVSKLGLGTLTLSALNNYGDSTTGMIISAGTLNINNDNNLGDTSAQLIIDGGGTLQVGPGVVLVSTRTVNLSGGSGTVDTQANTLTINGQMTGAGLLNKLGAGTLILSNTSNNYSGGTTVSAGILQGPAPAIQGNISTATGTIVDFTQVSSGTYIGAMSGLGKLQKDGAGTLILSGANTYTGGTDLNLGILQGPSSSIQGNIIALVSTIVDFVQPSDGTYSGVMSGLGTLQKDGAGTLTLSGPNTYTGGSTVNGGVLQGTTTSLQGTFTTALNTSVAFNQSGSGSFGGGSNVINGSGSLLQLGSGTVTLTSANGYSGGTVINAGVLSVGSDTYLGTGPLTFGMGTLQFTSSVTSSKSISLNGSGSIDTQVNTVNLTGPITGLGSLIKLSGGTLVLTGSNNFSGGTTVSGGILQGPAPAIQGNISTTTGTNVNFTQAVDGSYSGVMSGSGVLQKNGVGTLTLSGANTYSGGTALNSGILQGSALSIQGNITALVGTTVDFVQPIAGTYGGVMSGAGGLQKDGAGTLTLSGVNTYTGGSTVNGGILQGTTTSLQGAFTTAVNTSVAFNQSGSGSFGGGSNVINGSGSLIQMGPGTVTLTSANGYSGGTVINGGILSVSSDTYLGNLAGSLTFGTGTLQYTSGMTSSRNITLNGAGSIDTQANTVNLTGQITGIGSMNKLGGGTLILTGSNNYQGGNTVTGGTLQGSTTSLPGNITVHNGANVTFNQAVDGTYTGVISGAGSLTKIGASTLILSGANSYSGGTTINFGVLQGTATSLQGAMTLNGTSSLTFNQTSSGSYGGQITGPAGSFLNIQGGGILTMTGSSSGFSGSTTVSGNSQLVVMGSLANSPIAIGAGSILSGTGTIGSTTNSGQITPGSSGSGTLSVNGTLVFSPGGSLVTHITPSGNNLLAVSGTATLTGGTSIIQMGPGFYGFTGTRTILTAGTVSGPFSFLQLDPRIEGHLVYNPTNVQLVYQVLHPFLDFPFANANERAVGNNLEALILTQEVSSDLLSVFNSMDGLTVAEVNDALDQMHPAALSAFAELQTELGGQLLSLFHRRPQLACSCTNPSRLWVEPYGNWLHEKKQGMEIGFHATTRGVAIGYDYQFMGCWTLGLAGAYNKTDLSWSLDRGYAYIEGAYGSFYTDLALGNFFLGASVYAGKDWYDTMRQMHFSTIDRQAKSNSDGLDLGGQLTTAYFFGAPSCLLYPYATVDYLYLQNGSFKESGSHSLDLGVASYTSSTLRTEAGGAIRLVDRNRNETICISPLISMGYVLELPLHREHYTSTFSGATIPFSTQGWDMAWQLLNLRFGLGITYRCFTLDTDYSADISPEGDSPFFNQRANFRMSCNF